MTETLLTCLERFFSSQCNGEWELDFGIEITTTSNPGWYVKIELVGTDYGDHEFPPIRRERTESDWVLTKCEHSVWHGSGGASNLVEILSVFAEQAGLAKVNAQGVRLVQ